MPRTGPFGWGNRVGQQDPQGQRRMWCPASKCYMELSSRCWSGHSGCGTMQAEGAQKCHFLCILFTVAFSCQRFLVYLLLHVLCEFCNSYSSFAFANMARIVFSLQAFFKSGSVAYLVNSGRKDNKCAECNRMLLQPSKQQQESVVIREHCPSLSPDVQHRVIIILWITGTPGTGGLAKVLNHWFL